MLVLPLIILLITAGLTVLLVRTPGRLRWLRVVVALVVLVEGVALAVTSWQVSQARRERGIAVTHADDARAKTTAAYRALARVRDAMVTIGRGVPPATDPETRALLEKLRQPARVRDRKLTAGAYAWLPQNHAGTSQSATASHRERERALASETRRHIAAKLESLFDELANDVRIEVELEELQVALQLLAPEKRRRLAEKVAELPDIVAERRHIEIEDDARVIEGVEVAVTPERVLDLLPNYCATEPSCEQVGTGTLILATVGVLFAAAFVLKLATRRHARRLRHMR